MKNPEGEPIQRGFGSEPGVNAHGVGTPLGAPGGGHWRWRKGDLMTTNGRSSTSRKHASVSRPVELLRRIFLGKKRTALAVAPAPTSRWEPLPDDVAEWMGMDSSNTELPRSA